MTAPTAASVATEPAGFQHETVFYREADDLVHSLLPYVHGGLDRDEAVVMVAPPARLDLLHDALADDAPDVEFLDMTDVGANPARIIAAWQDVLARHLAAGRGVRGIGEPAYAGRRPAELLECHLHELLLDRAFDGGPGWRLLCPYDERRLPAEVCRASAALHPLQLTADGSAAPSGGTAPDVRAAFAAALPRPTEGVIRGRYADGDVHAVRRTVASFARTSGATEEQAEALELAASELATNSLRHGGGAGTVAMWLQPDALIVEFTDRGHITEPLTGRFVPAPDQFGGRGLYLVNQLCDLVQVRSSPAGTTVRLLTWV